LYVSFNTRASTVFETNNKALFALNVSFYNGIKNEYDIATNSDAIIFCYVEYDDSTKEVTVGTLGDKIMVNDVTEGNPNPKYEGIVYMAAKSDGTPIAFIHEYSSWNLYYLTYNTTNESWS
jgi:hypothetical protein